MQIGSKYLITTDNWFFAPDGKQYRAVWGQVMVIESDNLLGIKTNSKATNWYLSVGTDANHVIIAGCQIHYAVCCPTKPNTENYVSEDYHEGQLHRNIADTRIYVAE